MTTTGKLALAALAVVALLLAASLRGSDDPLWPIGMVVLAVLAALAGAVIFGLDAIMRSGRALFGSRARDRDVGA